MKQHLSLLAPDVDHLIHVARHYNTQKDSPLSQKAHALVLELKKLKVQGDDDFRSLYIEAGRGDITDYGIYEEFLEEGMVGNYDDFVDLWTYDYPEETKWYKLVFIEYAGVYYISVDGDLIMQFQAGDIQNDQDAAHNHDELCDWLCLKVNDAVERLSADASAYNTYIEKKLSFRKRLGRIRRMDYWAINADEENYFRSGFTNEDILRFKEIAVSADRSNRGNRLKRMHAGDFFTYCRVCYEANDYFAQKKKPESAREMYLAMADGRDCGLRNIDLESDEDFLRWYQQESHCGGHPWEICRGGNSTHISLYVVREQDEWMLVLAGSSRARAVETIKMALALHKHNVPFSLRDASALYDMLTGTDCIGIVPEYITPRYCHSLFPKEDRIIDFMNLYAEDEKEIISKANWYPVLRIELDE